MEKKDNIYLSVVIPAYNEETRIGDSLSIIESYLVKQDYKYEIVVVDDGSTDETVSLVKNFSNYGATIHLLPNEENRGKGYSVRRGMLEAGGELILFSDADLSTPIEEIEKLLPWFKEGYDVAIGSRGLSSSNIVVHQPFYREKMGRVFNVLVQLLNIKGIKDTQCGFKCFTKEAARNIFSRQKLDGFSFDVECLCIASRLNYKIKEVPIHWYNSPNSRVNPLSDSLSMFIDLVRIRLLT